jgi:beta-1,4-N-acetylglucosaminyltransferase
MKLCLVCSHGGHMTELLELSSVWNKHEVFFITYKSVRSKPASTTYEFGNLTEKPLRILPMFWKVLNILRKERPGWVVSDGAEIAIPVFIAARILGIRTLFIESVCRVNKPSFSGRLLYPLSNVFFVQWPSLLDHYGPKARYEGAVL